MNKIAKVDTTQLEKVVTESGLAITEGEQIKQSYQPFLIQLSEIQEMAAKINFESPAELDEKIARDLRLKTVKIRTGAEKIKDERKRGYLLKGNLEQAAYNLIKASCELTENAFSDVEKAREIAEKKRKEALKIERTSQLMPYVENCELYPLGEMSEQAYSELYTGMKAAYEARIEAEAKAEADRIAKAEAEKAEQERIRKENERLQAEIKAKEAEAERIRKEAEAELQAEREAAAKKQAEIEAAAKAEREKAEAAAAAAKKEADRLAAIEAEKRKEAEAEAERLRKAENDRIEAEKAAERAKVAKAKKLAKDPEKEKLQRWVNQIKITEPITGLSPEGKVIADEIEAKFAAFKAWANKQIETI